jgi:hypothetical protein
MRRKSNVKSRKRTIVLAVRNPKVRASDTFGPLRLTFVGCKPKLDPMLTAHAKTKVHASPEVVYEFLMDVEHFPSYDEKAVRLEYLDRERDIVRISGVFGIFPYQADFKVTREPGKGYQTELISGPLEYARGQFWVHPLPEGCELTHIEQFRFHGPFSWLLEQLLQSYVQGTVEREVAEVKRQVEAALTA